MDKMVKTVVEKLEEYGIQVFDSYKVKNEDEYMIMAEKMIVALRPEEKKLKVAFHVSTPPDVAGNYTLILKELSLLVEMMEVFTYTGKKFLSGEDAISLAEKSKKEEIITAFVQEQMLLSLDFKKFPRC